MTQIRIDGQPLGVFTFHNLPSWNKSYNHWGDRRKAVAQMRAEGAKLAHQLILKIPKDQRPKYLVQRAFMLIRVFPAHDEISDITNVNIKHVCDGFTDAKVWKDDEWAFVPFVAFQWGGKDPDPQYKQGKRSKVLMRKTIIEVHSLEGLWINGEEQPLPLGRVWRDAVDEDVWVRIAATEEW